MDSYHQNLFTRHRVSRGVAVNFSVNLSALPRRVHCHATRHAAFQTVVGAEWVVVAQDINCLLHFGEAAVDDKVQVGEGLFQVENPVPLQGRDGPVLLRVQAFQVGFA